MTVVLTSESKKLVQRYLERNKDRLSEQELYLSLMGILSSRVINDDVRTILMPYIGRWEEFFQKKSRKDLDDLIQDAKNVVEYCYEKYLEHAYSSKEGGENVIELEKMCVGLSGCEEGDSVYMPFAKYSEMAYLGKKAIYDGCETDKIAWAVGQIIMQIHGVEGTVKQVEWLTNERYDCVLSYNLYDETIQDKERAKLLVNLLNEHLVENGGSLCCVVPKRFCIAESWRALREAMLDVEKKRSTKVAEVNLAGKSNVCVVCCKNDGKGEVELADMSKDDVTWHNIVLKLQRNEWAELWRGGIADIDREELDLTPQHSLVAGMKIELKEGEREMALEDLIEPLRLHKNTEEVEMKAIKLNMMSSMLATCDIKSASLEVSKLVSGSKTLTEDCLLVGYNGYEVKIGRVMGITEGMEVGVGLHIMPFKLKEGCGVSEDYLLNCLLSDVVKVQVERLAVGTIVKRVKSSDWSKVRVVIAAEAEQKAVVNTTRLMGLGVSSEGMQKQVVEARQDMLEKKEAMGEAIFNLSNWWTVMQNNKSNIEEKVFDGMGKAMKQIQAQVFAMAYGYELLKEEVMLPEYLKRYIAEHPHEEFRYEYMDGDNGEAIENFGMVDFSVEALDQIMNCVVDNAIVHGFKGNCSDRNRVRIGVGFEEGKYVVRIANNGAAIEDERMEENMFKFGKGTLHEGSHYGLGCYKVKKLMREFGGEAELELDKDNDYKVAFKLVFENIN